MPTLSVLVISLTFIATVNAGYCTDHQLQTIASSSHLAGCTKDVGFSIISSLTTTQIKEICASSACMKLCEDIEDMNFGDCTITDLDISLETGILDPVAAACGGSASNSRSQAESTTTSSSPSSKCTLVATSSIALALIMLLQ